MTDIAFNNEQLGKVYTFWSPQVGSGTTFIALQTAKRIAERGLKTILVDWDFRTPTLTRDLNAKDTAHYIDNILPSALAKNVSKELLQTYTLNKGENFYFLSGITNPEQALDIEADGLEYLLQLLKENFDVVIIDTNSFIDNAGTFVALVKADKVMMPIEKKYQSLRCFEYSRGFMENPRIMDFEKVHLVLNKVDKNILLSSQEVESYFGKDNSVEITNLGIDFINDDNIGKGEEFLRTSKKAMLFHDSIDNMIEKYFELPENAEGGKTKKRLFFGKGGK